MSSRDLPPVVEILLNEPFPKSSSPSAVKKFFRRLLPELRRQATWTLEQFRYGDDKPLLQSGFAVTASGALDPLSRQGVCLSPECRLRAADHFARTLGVYVDVATITDALTSRLRDGPRLTNADLLGVATDCLVIRRLKPLIEAGVIVFRKPGISFCDTHYREFEDRVARASSALLPQLQTELTFKVKNDYFEVKTGRLYDPPLEEILLLPDEFRRRLAAGDTVDDVGRELFGRTLPGTLRKVLIDLNSATKSGAALFSGSRLDLLSMNAIEGSAPDLDEVEHWEAERSVELPWVRNLNPEEVVRLREEAALALPRLREAILGTLAAGSGPAAIAALRNDAVEVEGALNALKPSRGSQFRRVAGALGITVAVYGVAAGLATPATALGSLGALLGLLHSSARKDEQDLASITSRPGYALLKARELKKHEH